MLMASNIDEYLISKEPWYRKNVFNWIMYDLGNTIFSMVVVSITLAPAVYILYFNQGLNAEDAINKGNLSISITVFIGNIIMAMFSPFLGAYSDQLEKRKSLLIKISLICILLMGSMIVIGYYESVFIYLVIFLFANLFYQMGLVIYDAMLPFITDNNKIGKIGALGVAIGYFGSFIGIGLGFIYTLGLGLPDFYAQPASEKMINGELVIKEEIFQLGYIPYIYPVAAVLFLLFTIPMYFVKEKPVNTDPVPSSELRATVKAEVIKTAKEVYNYRDMKYFLIGWLIFVDVANTVIFFMTPIVQVGLEFGEGNTTLVVLGLGIFSAVLFTYPIGIYVDKNGPKKVLTLILRLWLVSLIIAFFTNLTIGSITTPEYLVFIFPIVVGPALGGTWVVQRLFVTELSPPGKVGNYFGFSNIFGRISAAIGPFVWTGSIWYFNQRMGININFSTRLAIPFLGVLMLIGYFIIHRNVGDPHQAFLQGAKATGKGTWVTDDGQVLYDSSKNY